MKEKNNLETFKENLVSIIDTLIEKTEDTSEVNAFKTVKRLIEKDVIADKQPTKEKEYIMIHNKIVKINSICNRWERDLFSGEEGRDLDYFNQIKEVMEEV
jgi:hypothetical protein